MSSSVFTTILSIDVNARQFFAQIQNQPWAMLLDSGNSGHIDANIDIIVSDPIITLVTQEDTTTIDDLRGDNEPTLSHDNPFDLIDHQLAASDMTQVRSDLPFTGGAVGYFSYDLGRQTETLNAQAQKDIDLPEMAIGIYRHALVFNHSDGTATQVSRSTQAQHVAQVALNTQRARMTQPTLHSQLTGPWQHQLTKDQYGDKFNAVQNYLRQGDCYQINLTQRFQAPHQGDEYQTYLTLVAQNNTPFSGFIRLANAAILSVSPERFIQCHQDNIEAKPIKGTRPRSSDPVLDQKLAQELIDSEKDQSENLMIVDLLRNDIGRCAIAGSVKVPKLFDIESFKNVHHLVSTVQAKLPAHISPATLLKRAFPGGSITGAPKIRAMNIIDELEPHRRSIYCGSIGYISADRQMDTNITIRTLLCINDTLYCWAGGGIVADSTVDEEYQECFDKVASILPVLQK